MYMQIVVIYLLTIVGLSKKKEETLISDLRKPLLDVGIMVLLLLK